MKNLFSKGHLLILASLVLAALVLTALAVPQKKKKKQQAESVETITSNIDGKGIALTVELKKGAGHNHPLMAIWIEDLDGNYLQTLFVARSIAKGEFAYGDKSSGKWQAGEVLRPAALPYWSHKRNILNDKGNYMPRKGYEVPDAYSGATPSSGFRLLTRTDQKILQNFRILCEINQSWDWNKYWTNTRYPDDKEYKTSSQPAVVYAAEIDPSQVDIPVRLEAIGRGHQSGTDGVLYHDLETITTALRIYSEITATVNKK